MKLLDLYIKPSFNNSVIKNLIHIVLLIVLACNSSKRIAPTIQVLEYAKDSLLVDVRAIDNQAAKTISIYVLDASLDKRIANLQTSLSAEAATTNYRIIGIGHTTYSNALRKRDFAPPNDTTFFGQKAGFNGRADEFISFIQDSILPIYDATADKRILVGHSFGGLFGVYVSTLDSQPFDEIYALSPSLWVNSRSFAKHYLKSDSLYIKTPLHISYGSLEQLNLVGPSIKNWQANLKDKDTSLVDIKCLKGKTHFSMIREINKLKL